MIEPLSNTSNFLEQHNDRIIAGLESIESPSRLRLFWLAPMSRKVREEVGC